MKRLFSSLLLVLSVCSVSAEDLDWQSVFREYLEQTIPFTENTEGSENERALSAWITGILDASALPYRLHDFSDAWETHSFSSILEVDLPGALEDTLIIAVPLNRRQEEKNLSGAAGVVTALTAIEYFSRQKLPLSLKVLFLGAEFGPEGSYPMGSGQYLREFYPEHPVAILYLDILRPSSTLRLVAGGDKTSSPLWLLESGARALGRAGIEFDYSATETLCSRLGVLDSNPVIDPYLQAGHPAILLTDGEAGGESSQWMNHFITFLETLLSIHDRGLPSQWDRNYLFLHFRGIDIAVGETAYITGLIVLLCLLLLYPFIFTRSFSRYVRALGKKILFLPILLLAVYLFLLLGTLPALAIPRIQRFPDIWAHAPYLYFALKCVTAVLLFTLLFHLIRHIPLPGNSSFYSAGAILFLSLDIFILSFIDISLTMYLAWALFFAFLFTLMANRYLKIVCFFLSPVWLFLIMHDLFTLPVLGVCRFLIYSTVRGNLLIAFILLPFLLMFIRIDFLFAHPKTRRRNIIVRGLFIVLLGAFLYLTVTLFLFDPYKKQRNRPMYVDETIIPGLHAMEISNPSPLDGWEGRYLSLTLPRIPIEHFFTTRIKTDTFLDRMNISLRIHSTGGPEEITVTLTSEEKIIMYDSSFPYSTDPDTGFTHFYIGRNPPADLLLELTLPSVLEGSFHITSRYNLPVFDVQAGEQTLAVQRTLTVNKTIPISLAGE